MYALLNTICVSIGIIVLIASFVLITLKLLIFIWNLYTTNIEWCGGPNTWAVVTGSTDGIGLAYAKQLAEKGYNLLLLSRNLIKLNEVKQEIELIYKNCSVRTLAVDFTQNDIYDQIEAELKFLTEIHVLVNNVGITYECPEYFTQIPDLNRFTSESVNVNIIAVTRLMALVLPAMEVRGRGVIINISSFAAKFPMPLLALYSATKVYIDFLTRALNEEYKQKGITIQSVLPFYVSTKMIRNLKTSLLVPTADQYVRSALKTVGNESQTHGYISHKFIALNQNIGSNLFGINFLIKMAFNHLFEIRRRFLANQDITQLDLRLFIPTKRTNNTLNSTIRTC